MNSRELLELEQNPYILLFLDNLYKKRICEYHDLFNSWTNCFIEAGIQVFIVRKEIKDKRNLNPNFIYIDSCDNEVYSDFHIYQKKSIFGKEQIIYKSCFFVIYESKILKEFKRINQLTLEKALFLAIDKKNEKNNKKIKKMIDMNKKL